MYAWDLTLGWSSAGGEFGLDNPFTSFDTMFGLMNQLNVIA